MISRRGKRGHASPARPRDKCWYSGSSAIDCPGSEKDITEVSGTSSPGSIPGRGTTYAISAGKIRVFRLVEEFRFFTWAELGQIRPILRSAGQRNHRSE